MAFALNGLAGTPDLDSIAFCCFQAGLRGTCMHPS